MWIYEPRPTITKPAKAPYTPKGIRADINKPYTWSSFDNVIDSWQRSTRFDGIGYVLTKNNPVVGIDLDNCIQNQEYTPQAQAITKLLDSYTEISPSGKGLRILVNAEVGDFTGKRKGDLELYSYHRYLSITGNKLESAPATIEPRITQLREMYKLHLADTPSAHHPPIKKPELLPTDQEILQHLFDGKLGDLYSAIYYGDISQIANHDESRADTLLFNGLAYYTKGDRAQMRRLLLNSPRAMQRQEKWNKHISNSQIYFEYQIEDSINYTTK
jgi:putative DNA primase/helicase